MSSKLKMRILVLVSAAVMAISTLACVKTGGGGPCDIAGPKTALTTCLAQEISK